MTIVIRLALEGSSGGETVLVFVTEEETKKERGGQKQQELTPRPCGRKVLGI